MRPHSRLWPRTKSLEDQKEYRQPRPRELVGVPQGTLRLVGLFFQLADRTSNADYSISRSAQTPMWSDGHKVAPFRLAC